MKHQANREQILVQLRRERSLTAAGTYYERLHVAEPARAAIGPEAFGVEKLLIVCAILFAAGFFAGSG
jgi:hypothetical protein